MKAYEVGGTAAWSGGHGWIPANPHPAAVGVRDGEDEALEHIMSLSGGEPVEGLYAAGNVRASPFGMTYGGEGGALGPAMVFAYLAGPHSTRGYDG